MKALALAGRVVSCDTPPLEDAGVLFEDGLVVAVDRRAAFDGTDALVVCDARAGTITPGLVDAHTHAAWVGWRHDEYEIRLRGGDYEEIAAAGGGIVASMRAVHEAREDEIVRTLVARLRRMRRLGVTTVEVKSGYGLTHDGELLQLRAIARAARAEAVPRVVPTFLALHAVPPDRRGDRARWLSEVLEQTLPLVAREGLAAFCDAYVDRAAFSVDEARPVLARAAELGLGVRLHAGQFADVGGADLAASLGGRSADHLEHVSRGGLVAMAEAGTSAVLLPIASFTLGQAPPPVEAMRAAGVSLVVASDANPGTAPTESLPLALALAARSYGLTPDECLLGATARAARALDLPCGVLRRGAPADLAVWDLSHEKALVEPWGAPPLVGTVVGGVWEAAP